MVTNANYNIKQSYELPGYPTESISRLCWCGERNLLSAGSWDKTVRVWAIQGSHQAQPLAMFNHTQPVLDSSFTNDGRVLFAGGCDNQVKAYDLSMGNNQQGQLVATHDRPVSGIAWCDPLQVLITVSWDGCVKFWDGKQDKPVFLYSGRKVNCFDMKYPYLAVADTDNKINIWDMTKMTQINTTPMQVVMSNLKLQIRSISLFQDTTKPGFVSVEVAGRCGVQYFDKTGKEPSDDFAFRCHRITGPNPGQDKIFAVNSVDVNVRYNTLATSGSDGTIVFWDKDNKQRLKAFDSVNWPIVDGKFHPQGLMFAYAISYDWSKAYDPQLIRDVPNKVYLHQLTDEDIRPRPKNR